MMGLKCQETISSFTSVSIRSMCRTKASIGGQAMTVIIAMGKGSKDGLYRWRAALFNW